MSGAVKSAVQKRLSGDKPSPLQAAIASVLVAGAAFVITYRLMRS
jgi:hypothetical protein